MARRGSRSLESPAAEPDDDFTLVQRLIDANDVGTILRQMRDQHSTFIRHVVDRRVAPSPSAVRPTQQQQQLLSPLYAPQFGAQHQRSANASVLSPSMDDDDESSSDKEVLDKPKTQSSTARSPLTELVLTAKMQQAAKAFTSPAKITKQSVETEVPGTPTPSTVHAAEDEPDISTSRNGRGRPSAADDYIRQPQIKTLVSSSSNNKRPQLKKSPHQKNPAENGTNDSSTPEKRATKTPADPLLSPGALRNVSLRNNLRQQQLKKNYDQLVKQSVGVKDGPALAAGAAAGIPGNGGVFAATKLNVTTFSIDGPVPPEVLSSQVKPEDDPFLLHAPFGYAQPAAHNSTTAAANSSSSHHHHHHHAHHRDPFEGGEGDALSSRKSSDGSRSDDDEVSGNDHSAADPIVVERQQHLRSAAAASTGMKLRGTHYAVTPAGGVGSAGVIHHTRNATNETIGDYFETATLPDDGHLRPQIAAGSPPPPAGPSGGLTKQKSASSVSQKQSSAAREVSPDVQNGRNSGRKKDVVSSPAAATAAAPSNATNSSKARAVQQSTNPASKDKPPKSSATKEKAPAAQKGPTLAVVVAAAASDVKAPTTPRPATTTADSAAARPGPVQDETVSDDSGSYSYSTYSYSSDYTSGSFTSSDGEDSPVRPKQSGIARKTEVASARAEPPPAPKVQPRNPTSAVAPAKVQPKIISQQKPQQQQQQQLTRSASASNRPAVGKRMLEPQQGIPRIQQLRSTSSAAVISVVPPSQLHLYKTPQQQPLTKFSAPLQRDLLVTTNTAAGTNAARPVAVAVPSQPKMVMPHPYAPYAIPIEDYQRQTAAAAAVSRFGSASSQSLGSTAVEHLRGSSPSLENNANTNNKLATSSSALPRFVARTPESDSTKYVWQSSERGYLAPAVPSTVHDPPATLPDSGRSASAMSLDNPVPIPSSRANSPAIVTSRFSIVPREN